MSKQSQSLCARNYIYDIVRQPWFDYGYTAMCFDEQTERYFIRENLTYNVGNDLWGGGINFNGCIDKNTTKDNYLNTDPATNDITAAITAESGIDGGRSCVELVVEAQQYLYDILNPTEKYDETDYYAYKPHAQGSSP